MFCEELVFVTCFVNGYVKIVVFKKILYFLGEKVEVYMFVEPCSLHFDSYFEL